MKKSLSMYSIGSESLLLPSVFWLACWDQYIPAGAVVGRDFWSPSRSWDSIASSSGRWLTLNYSNMSAGGCLAMLSDCFHFWGCWVLYQLQNSLMCFLFCMQSLELYGVFLARAIKIMFHLAYSLLWLVFWVFFVVGDSAVVCMRFVHTLALQTG